MDNELSFGRWVKQRRKSLDLTQHELAQRVGCALSTLQKLETNARQPSRQLAELLAHHLDLTPGERDAFLHLARSRPTPAPPTLIVPFPARRPIHNLPSPLTSLVGREWEVLTLHASLLEDNVRLLTITGPPGIGKTRLALRVAQTMSGFDLDEEATHTHWPFADGVCFVALAPLAEARFVPAAIGRALGIEDTGGQPLVERIKAHLRRQSALLVLDNFEHVLSAAPLVVDLLEAAPHLKILVTSRATLQVYGEHEFIVLPLALPDLKRLPVSTRLTRYGAVELFVQRAQAVQPEFRLDETNAQAVAELCIRLEGLPLALELAAARSKLFAPQALLTRLIGTLDPQFDLLASPRHLPVRHRSLRSAIAWSYDLLNPTEQVVFRCLGVFAGGCTLEAVEAVWSSTITSWQEDQGLAPSAHPMILSSLQLTLQSLVDHSLVIAQPEADGNPRFSMLEMIREYALEQLEQQGEAKTVRRAHAAHFVQLAERCAAIRQAVVPAAEAPRQSELGLAATQRVEQELDNLRTARRWVAEHDLEQELRLIAAMTEFWPLRHYLGEARQWIEERLPLLAPVASQLPPQSMAHYATVVEMLAFFTYLQGDFALAQTRFEESIPRWRQLQDRTQLGMALARLACTFYHRGDYTAARASAEESVHILRELDESWQLGYALDTLAAVTLVTGDHATARRLWEECLAVFRNIGSDWGISLGRMSLGMSFFTEGNDTAARSYLVDAFHAFRRGDLWRTAQTLVYVGKVAWRTGDWAQATAYWDESVLLARELGAKRLLGEALFMSGLTAQENSDLQRAKALFKESLALYQAMENQIGVAYALSGLASVIEPPAKQAQLLGAAATVLETARLPMDQIERAYYESAVVALRAQLDEATFAAAWAAGQAMSLDQAMDISGIGY